MTETCDSEHDSPESEALPAIRRTLPRLLCSLRIVSVSSDRFLGRRYVMELASSSRSRELRVYRSLEQLMEAVAKLGLQSDLLVSLERDLCEEGSCTHLDIVI